MPPTSSEAKPLASNLKPQTPNGPQAHASVSLWFTLLRSALCIAASVALFSCSSQAERGFKGTVSRLSSYLSQQPHLLTSRKITKDGQTMHVYYALKVHSFQLDYSVERTFLADVPYQGFITVSCTVMDNSDSGDVSSDMFDFAKTLEPESKENKGFSTLDLALRNGDFSAVPEALALYVKYAYVNDKWILKGLSTGAAPGLLLADLEQLPQNKPFRQAIGMES